MRVAFLAAVFSFSALPIVCTQAVAQPASCPASQTFVVGGMNDPQGWAYANSGPHTVVPYSASIWPVGPISHDESVAEGTRNLEAAVRAVHTECPDTPITISGYSEGAEVAGDVRDNLAADPTINHTRFNAVLYSDPRREGGVSTVLAGVFPGLTLRGPRPTESPIATRQVCIRGDLICDARNPLVNPIGFVDSAVGYFVKHQTYSIDPARDAGSGTTVIDTPPSLPIPSELAYADTPIVPTPQEILQPIVQPILDALPVLDADTVWLPPAPQPTYVPTPVGQYLPPPVAAVLPPVVRDHILPPLPW